jgi:hypothetical protein
MKVTAYLCDRCGATVPEDDVTKVEFSHGRGKFDLRDETFELCPACDEEAVAWMMRKDKEKRP